MPPISQGLNSIEKWKKVKTRIWHPNTFPPFNQLIIVITDIGALYIANLLN